MLEVNAEKTLASLEKVKAEMTKRLENMVKEFTRDVTLRAIDITPYGDDDKYRRLYESRANLKHIGNSAGYAKGGWVLSVNQLDGDMFPAVADSREASNIKQDISGSATEYKLGENVYISNLVPYMTQDGWPFDKSVSIEEGGSDQAPDGVRKPLINYIMSAYASDIQRHYSSAK